MQFKNAVIEKVESDFGSHTEVRLLQKENALLPMIVSEFGS